MGLACDETMFLSSFPALSSCRGAWEQGLPACATWVLADKEHSLFITHTMGLSSYREAWNKLGDLAKMEAMEKYLTLVDSLDPNWEQQPADTTSSVRRQGCV